MFRIFLWYLLTVFVPDVLQVYFNLLQTIITTFLGGKISKFNSLPLYSFFFPVFPQNVSWVAVIVVDLIASSVSLWWNPKWIQIVGCIFQCIPHYMLTCPLRMVIPALSAPTGSLPEKNSRFGSMTMKCHDYLLTALLFFRQLVQRHSRYPLHHGSAENGPSGG